MVLVFDLDDTLYDELTYVESGFDAVAKMLAEAFEISAHHLKERMMQILKQQGRGAVFDLLLQEIGAYTKNNVHKALSCYRTHQPSIAMSADVRLMLLELSRSFPLYLVTDGNKEVQYNKIKALKIAPLFKKVYITHRYGLKHAKPSLYCFEKIRQKEKCSFADMTYIGDNPHKDFVNLKKQGAKTIRVMTGSYRQIELTPDFEADQRIDSVLELKHLINVNGSLS
ncbi:MAG: HAD family hydrolase [Candidatus Sericytochromatia bacterium]|nr:HAD family hydrolase [Candidatus Sericytochromatia bacterium]